tara:strand:- start:25 stop:393 length:369 start_codon:yes stop_codon:yes gene_type:complete
MKIIKNNSTKTVLIITVGFTIVFLIFRFEWVLITAIIVGVLGILSNKISIAIDFLWMKLTNILSFIVPNILMSAIFYFFLTPIAIMSKIFGNKNALQLKKTNDSLWVDKNSQIEKVSFEKMW